MPGKGKKHTGAAKGSKEHGDKKAAGASKPAEKKAAEATEKKPGTSGVSQPAGAQGSGATGTSKAQPSQEKIMKPADPKKQPAQEKPTKTVDPKAQPTQEKPPTTDPKTQPSHEKPKPADTKPKQTPKSEPARSTQSTKPKDTATSTVTAKTSTGKPASKQDPKPASGKEKTESKVSSGAAGKVAATAVAGTVVAAATAGAVTAVSTKPKDEGKEVKKAVGADKVSAAAPAPAKSAADDAMDDLIDSLGGPENVPESPKFTGPEIKEDPRSSEHLEGLGERDSTIPPDYRNLLDGKGEKPVIPYEDLEPPLGEDDLLDALSSDFASCPAPPEGKKPKLETMAIKPTCATAVSSEPGKELVPDDALDELLGTLEGPPANEPDSPIFTGPVVTETIIPTYLEKVGERESSIPPEYRKLLDGKDHGKDVPPPAPAAKPKPLDDFELADEFSKDFDSSDYPSVPVVATSTSTKPTACKAAKPITAREVIASSASNTQAAAAPSSNVDSALDELMGTLDGPEFALPESPDFTGPVVTETSTATNLEELGKRESTIPPKYRNLLDGKVDGKVVPPPPEEKPMDEDELAAALDFGCSTPSSDKPTLPADKPTLPADKPTLPADKPTPPAKPKDSTEKAKADSDVISASCSSAVQSAPAPSKQPVPKASALKSDPFDALSGTLGVRQAEGNKDKKPAADPVKEKTDKEKRDKLGEDENTIPPDYRLEEVKDKDGKPILPKREDQPKEMSEDDLLDALTEGFLVSPATTTKTAPLQCSAKDAKSKPGAEEVVSCSKASAVQAGAPQPAKAGSQIPDDALDLLSGSLGTRELDPEDNKPLVDKVKEKATSEHIERLGDRDSTIPPEYRHLLDGKDDKGQPIKPPAKEDANREKSSDGAAAIDALSSDFESCATKSTEKTQQTSKDKAGKCSSGTAVSQPSGKASEPAKEKTEKCSSSTKESQSSGKASDPPKDKTEKCSSATAVSQPSEPAKPKNETSPAKPSAQKPYRS